MKQLKEIMIEELGQYYSQCEQESRKCNYVRFQFEFRAGRELLYCDHKLSKIPLRINRNGKVTRVTIECN